MHDPNVTDVVLLIPGFLAFDRLGKHSYFAETVSKALEDNLRLPAPRKVKVVPITMPAVDTLARRQQALVAAMRQNLTSCPNAVIHLVGHSTGGLDAELLTRAEALGGAAWSRLDTESEHPRLRLASITTIASPLAGTTLASAPLARIVGTDFVAALWKALQTARRDRTLPTVYRQLEELLKAVPRLLYDRAVHQILRVPTDLPRLLMFLWNVVHNHGLVFDLQSDDVERVMRTNEDPLLADVARARFLTIAPPNKKPSPEGKLFDSFYTATAEGAEGAPAPGFLAPLLSRVSSGQVRTLAGNPELLASLLPRLDASDNDGIVNTLRQLPPEPLARLDVELERVVAVVLADHLDVVGYYPSNQLADKNRLTRIIERGTSQNGFLESGAEFRDPELLALYARVAAHIAETSPALVHKRLASASVSAVRAA